MIKLIPVNVAGFHDNMYNIFCMVKVLSRNTSILTIVNTISFYTVFVTLRMIT